MRGRDRAAMACVEELQQVESFAAANLSQNDTVEPVAECCL